MNLNCPVYLNREESRENHEESIQELQAGRDQVIVRTSILGIAANVLLAAFKAAVGLITNSIAVVLDAVNNLSDALSSVITIVGTKLAGKAPDKKHPLGYGRVEYLSAMIVSAIVLYAGITSLVESVKKIIHPETPDYGVVSLVIIAAAVAVKIALGLHVKRTGQRVNSAALTASGADALNDAILSVSVLASAVVFLLLGVSLEAYVGVVIAVFIIRAGLEMLTETLDDILGKRLDADTRHAIKATICQEEQVMGAFDLILHSYGPELLIGSVHVEVPDTMTAEEIDAMERRLARTVYKEHGVLLTGIGIYAVNVSDPEVSDMRDRVLGILIAHEGVLQMHGFKADTEARELYLDVILDYALENREGLFEDLCRDVRAAYPDYNVHMTMDIDI